MNSRYASGKYSFEIRLSEEVPGDGLRDDRLALDSGGDLCRCAGSLWLYGNAPERPAAGCISPVSARYRPVGAKLLEPPDLRGSSFVNCRFGRNHAQCSRRAPDRPHVRIPWGKVDLAVQRFVDACMAFPGLLILLTVMSIVG